ncbi:GNAT family N-acetyltransferase [Ruegeria lacuscaerulensis]|uniref:GNAT family N-acetyltransferase n=1 Tax=Ruegeria lacuscaerulensis TaxID=55218 RepID=UPI00147E90BC|nr:GNAT family N-acetyltransferase [Ruegeria lacuscaerulensis]
MKQTDHNVHIRDADKRDIPRLLSMVRALAAHHGDNPQVNTKALERDAFGTPPWIHVLVAEVGDDIVGYASLCPLIQLQLGRRGIDMHHLYIEQDFRDMGIGRQLIECSKQKARDLSCSYMMVGTHPDNSDAQAVYLACGFEPRQGNGPRFGISLES